MLTNYFVKIQTGRLRDMTLKVSAKSPEEAVTQALYLVNLNVSKIQVMKPPYMYLPCASVLQEGLPPYTEPMRYMLIQ